MLVAEKWKPHRPLKVGIADELVTLGLLRPDEVQCVFRHYVGRLMYQRALAAGGPRYGLDGEPDGTVTPKQVAGAKSVVASIEAKRAAQAEAVAGERKAAIKAAKTGKATVLAKTEPTAKTLVPPKAPKEVQPATAVSSVKPAKRGLAELKAVVLPGEGAAHG